MCRGGAIIIESKSVTSAVRINGRGEWTRQWNGAWTGMPSPIQQAKVQADFLRGLLQSHRESLRSKALFGLIQKGFQHMPIDVLVAISDHGHVERPDDDFNQVLKADQITDRVKGIVENRDVGFLKTALKDEENVWATLSDDEFERIKTFLLHRHTPAAALPRISTTVVTPVSTPSPVAPPVVTSVAACRHCNGAKLNIAYGYSYYYKCLTCDKNTPIDLTCPTCRTKARIRKEGMIFHKECECGYAAVVHTNTVA